jgi:hypothetical protein
MSVVHQDTGEFIISVSGTAAPDLQKCSWSANPAGDDFVLEPGAANIPGDLSINTDLYAPAGGIPLSIRLLIYGQSGQLTDDGFTVAIFCS